MLRTISFFFFFLLLLTLCKTLNSWPLTIVPSTEIIFSRSRSSRRRFGFGGIMFDSSMCRTSSSSPSNGYPSPLNDTAAFTADTVGDDDDDDALVLADRFMKLSVGSGAALKTSSSSSSQGSERQRQRKSSLSASTLGDIMASSSDLLVTSPSSSGLPGGRKGEEEDEEEQQSLAGRFGISHPLDRMALTANGNLQRLLSSYYDAPVAVVVDSCVQRQPEALAKQLEQKQTSTTDEEENFNDDYCLSSSQQHQQKQQQQQQSRPAIVWDRVVRLCVYNQTFCTARSVIKVRDPLCLRLVESGVVGLGQLFRFLDILPEFTLLKAGKMNNSNDGKITNAGGGGGFWRDYQLDCTELSCSIHEEFRPGMWKLQQDEGEEGVDDR